MKRKKKKKKISVKSRNALLIYNNFNKEVSSALRKLDKNGIDWRKHGKHSSVISQLWNNAKLINNNKSLSGDFIKYYSDSLNVHYESVFGECISPEVTRNRISILSESATSEQWWNLKSFYNNDISPYVTEKDVIWFEGFNYMSSFDLSKGNSESISNLEQLYSILNVNVGRSKKSKGISSSDISIVISEIYMLDECNIAVILTTENFDLYCKKEGYFGDIKDYGDRNILITKIEATPVYIHTEEEIVTPETLIDYAESMDLETFIPPVEKADKKPKKQRVKKIGKVGKAEKKIGKGKSKRKTIKKSKGKVKGVEKGDNAPKRKKTGKKRVLKGKVKLPVKKVSKIDKELKLASARQKSMDTINKMVKDKLITKKQAMQMFIKQGLI